MMHGTRQIRKKNGGEVIAASLCGLVSHHPFIHTLCLPPVLPLRGPKGNEGVCFTASWSESEWMMGCQKQAACSLTCAVHKHSAVFIRDCTDHHAFPISN